MAASVRIEDEAFSDVRYDVLAMICNLADADHARGKMAKLWRQCTQQQVRVLPASVVVSVLGPNAVEGLETSRLGEEVDGGIRICGTKGRIEWLGKLRKNAQKGGRAKAAKRQTRGSQEAPQTAPVEAPKSLPPPFPPAPAPAPAPAQEEPEEKGAPVAPTPLFLHGQTSTSVKVVAPSKPRAKRTTGSPEQRAIAAAAIAELAKLSGFAYGTETESHVAHVVKLLNGGAPPTVDDLIAVARDRAKEWGGDAKMHRCLRPETVFGPKFPTYLAQARSTSGSKPNGGARDDAAEARRRRDERLRKAWCERTGESLESLPPGFVPPEFEA